MSTLRLEGLKKNKEENFQSLPPKNLELTLHPISLKLFGKSGEFFGFAFRPDWPADSFVACLPNLNNYLAN